jgi:site-specific recombinase XerD
MTTSPLLGPLLQAFFADYLLTQKRASPRTVAAYRDCFRLLLKALHEATKTQPSALRLSDLDAPAILSFLDSLEQKRGNSVRSRNARLAAIRAFFRYVSFREPESIYLATRVLSIPVKRTTHKLVGYLSRAEVEAILAAPDQSSWSGRRDLALLLTLYNSGGRVSEITALKRTQVCFGSTTFIHLLGKGRKERTVPLWSKTARVLQTWFREIDSLPGDIAFPNARGRALSRYGVNYLIDRATKAASAKCVSLITKVVSPHLFRHSTAMHLLQSGVDIAVIALWLGHESIASTHIYVQTDLATKERALQKLAPVATNARRFRADDSLMAFLANL